MNLDEIAPIVEDAFKKALEEKRYPFGFSKRKGIGDKISTGSLKNSIHAIPSKDSLKIEMNVYGQWVQSGRTPGKKGVPYAALLKWVKARGIKGRDAKGKFITDKSLIFAIRNSIKKFGIRPSNWYDVAIENLFQNKQLEELLGDATMEDLINAIEGI
jgi:hypothetical protein